jgi:hypothetical protein
MALSPPAVIYLPARPAVRSSFGKASCGLDRSSIDYPFKGADHHTLAERTVSQKQPPPRDTYMLKASSAHRHDRGDSQELVRQARPCGAFVKVKKARSKLHHASSALRWDALPAAVPGWAGPALWAHRHGPRGGVPEVLNCLMIAVGAGRLLARCADLGALLISSPQPASQADLGR